METWFQILDKFMVQAREGSLKTLSYPAEWDNLKMKVSFGMGAPARIPWIAFTAPEMQVSNGFYPVYLYYKEQETLILSYGVSETQEFDKTWPAEILNSTQTIEGYFDKKVPRYGDSFVFKAYKIKINKGQIEYRYAEEDKPATETDLQSDLQTILDYYKKAVSIEISSPDSTLNQGRFLLEKHLEDFLIQNWTHSELGKKYDLIIEDGELVSQQYRTDIGPIDILAKDKATNCYVVIELKKNQTSDDTIGQLARYMGWIKKNKKDDKVKGIIIAGEFDKRVEAALTVIPNVEVFLYEVDFKLKEFKK